MPLLADVPELHFLTYDQLCEEIKRYEYRHGWALSVFLDPWEQSCLYVVADVPNAYNPGETVELRIRSAIPPIPSREYFAIWLSWRMQQIESHESREYLRRDGKPVFDPHDPVEPGGKDSR